MVGEEPEVEVALMGRTARVVIERLERSGRL
jgi:hypothetical protein